MPRADLNLSDRADVIGSETDINDSHTMGEIESGDSVSLSDLSGLPEMNFVDWDFPLDSADSFSLPALLLFDSSTF